MAKGQVRLDLMHGTTNPADLVSIKYQVSGADTEIDNGNIVVIGGLATGEREVRLGATPTATSAKSAIALIATPELNYEKLSSEDFTNKAGAIARGYRLATGGVFSVTIDAVAGRTTLASVTVGDIVELKAATKLNIVATATSGSTVIGKVIAKEGNWIVICVD